jgi:NitT/TauT family transport system ATP-binding protein
MPAKGAPVATETLDRQQQPPPQPARRRAEIEISAVSKRFAGREGEIKALEQLDLTVEHNEVLGIVGSSGCGKSTLLELVCGLDQPTKGRIEIAGFSDARRRLESCALMFQDDLLLPWRTALDNAALPLQLAGASRDRAREQALALFEQFGLGEFASASPRQLSGGMRQRVAFARTLLAGKPVLLLDEPFGSLDSITRAEMQQWLADRLAEQPRTVVLVTHDVEEALYLCDRVAVLSPRPGRVRAIVAGAPRDELPRSRTVTSPDFMLLRQQVLEALA